MKRTGMLMLIFCVGGCFELDLEKVLAVPDGGGITPDIDLMPPPIPISGTFPNTLPQKPQTLTNEALPAWTSGRALAVHHNQLFAVDSDNDNLVVLNRATGVIERTIPVGDHPEQVVVDIEGHAFVTLRNAGEVVRIDSGSKTVNTRESVGIEPTGLALSPDTKLLFVALRGENVLLTLRAQDLSVLERIEGILDRPRAIAATESAVTVVQRGDNFLQFPRAENTGYPVHSTVKAIMLRADLPWDNELSTGRLSQTVPNRGRAVTINPETGAPLVVHQQTMPGNFEESLLNSFLKGGLFDEEICEMEGEDTEDCAGTVTTIGGASSGYGGGSKTKFPGLVRPIETVVTGGGTLTPGSGGRMPVKAPNHDTTTLNARVAQPTDIHHHPTWTMAFVTGYGSDNVMVINTNTLEPMANPIALINVGAAPKAVAFSQDGLWAYTLNHHSFNISAIDLAPLFDAIEQPLSLESINNESLILPDIVNTMVPVTMEKEDHSTFEFGMDPLPKSAQIGRRIYTYVLNDKLNGDNRFACGSCHFEGAEDQMVWVTPDGIRQTPTLAGRLHDTAPFNWTGSEDSLAGNMTQTIDRMDGEGLSDVELASLEQFILIGLERPVNPYRLDTGLTDEQAIGSDLFHSPSVGCASCHSGPAYTDGKFYSVGTNNQMEDEFAMLFADLFEGSTLPTKFNTPSLRDLFATAPYFHNGSAETVMDVLDQTATTMGHTANLTLEQKEALVAYLLTL